MNGADDYGFTGQSSEAAQDFFGGGDDLGTGSAPGPSAPASTGYAAIQLADRERTEPDKIRAWREQQQQRLTEKDAAEERHIKEWQQAARKELDDWYKHRDEQLGKTRESNRAAERVFLAEMEDKQPGGEFERVCRVCDFNPKNSKNTRDVSRMRGLLLQLKQTGLQRQM